MNAFRAYEQQKNQAEALVEMAKNNNQTIEMLMSKGSSTFSQELERRGEQAENGNNNNQQVFNRDMVEVVGIKKG